MGMHANPLQNEDPSGLTPGDWSGPGNTAMCAYYDEMARAHPKCEYYKEAANTCRGGNNLVNLAVGLGIRNAWNTKSTSASEAAILESIRSGLIAADKKAREAKQVDCNTDCVFGNDIDAYHDDVFRAVGIDTQFYGGNLWNQGVYPNYVPKDPRGERNPSPLYSPWYQP